MSSNIEKRMRRLLEEGPVPAEVRAHVAENKLEKIKEIALSQLSLQETFEKYEACETVNNLTESKLSSYWYSLKDILEIID